MRGNTVSIIENLTKKSMTGMKIGRETYSFKNVSLQDEKSLHADANDRNKIMVFYNQIIL